MAERKMQAAGKKNRDSPPFSPERAACWIGFKPWREDIGFVNGFKRRHQYAFDEYFVQLSGNLRTAGMTESTARTIISYDTMLVPGLFQPPEHAEGVYHANGSVAEERIPELVQCRTDRQAILRRHHRPDCLFYVHELALQAHGGNPSHRDISVINRPGLGERER